MAFPRLLPGLACVMLELPVAAARGDVIPAVLLYQVKGVADLHSLVINPLIWETISFFAA